MNRDKARFPAFRDAMLILKGEDTTEKFAKKLGMARATVGFYEAGERIPVALGIKKIAETYNVSADWLLGLSEVKTRDMTISQACEMTGLSQSTVEKLKEPSELFDIPLSKFISLLIDNPLFPHFMYYVENAAKASVISLATPDIEPEDLRPDVLAAAQACNLYLLSAYSARDLFTAAAKNACGEMVDDLISDMDVVIEKIWREKDGK